jgi:hypothetical protein
LIVRGGCHCELVRFEASVPDDGPLEILDCNCSICRMTGYLHLIVPEAKFRLTDGMGETSTYRFGSGKARHIFCRQCGIKSYYKPRSHPDAISINWRCIDEDDAGREVRIVPFDGRDHPGAVGSPGVGVGLCGTTRATAAVAVAVRWPRRLRPYYARGEGGKNGGSFRDLSSH